MSDAATDGALVKSGETSAKSAGTWASSGDNVVIPKIEIRDLNFYYGDFQGLKNVTMNIFERRITAYFVEKLQIALTPISCEGALQSTIHSTNRRSVC